MTEDGSIKLKDHAGLKTYKNFIRILEINNRIQSKISMAR